MSVQTTPTKAEYEPPDQPVQSLSRIRLPSLRLRVSERKLLLFIVDALLLNGALIAALLLRTDFVVSASSLLAFSKWFVTLTIVWLVCAGFFDAYNLARAASVWHSLRSTGVAALVTVGIYTLIPRLTPSLQSRSLIFVFGALAANSIVLWRLAYARLFVQPWFVQRALVVGAGNAGRYLAAALQGAPAEANPFRGTGYELVGFVDDDGALQGQRIEDIPVLGGSRDLLVLAAELRVDEVILAITHRHAIANELFDALLQCRERGLRLSTMSALYERLLGRVPVEHVGRDLHVVVPMEETPGERLYGVAKRGLDLLAGLAGLLAIGLLVPPLWLINALSSPGPLFYRQRRVGLGGRCFDMYKFRSMRPDAEKDCGAVWSRANDDRVTPIGRLLRGTRLDELPQFINVLRGEMSLIGPRPERPEFVEELAQSIPFYRARHAVRPGITGWAQIRYNYGSSTEDAKVKLEYDLYYVKNAGFLLDQRILLQTIPVMFKMQG